MREIKNKLYSFRTYFGIGLTIFFFISIISYIFIKGFSSLSFDFVFGLNAKEGDSLMPSIINTLMMVLLTLFISVPVGVSSAVYLNEYAKKDSFVIKLIRLTTESLSGIPSIIFGLFGFLFFVIYLDFSWSIISGVLTLSIMVLPTVIRSTEEALKSVPDGFREGSYALGVGKLATILKIILPCCVSGILVSIILSMGRIIGETAALILTAGTAMKIAGSVFNSGASLSVFLYTLTIEGLGFDKAYATAIVLMVIVFALNLLANLVSKMFRKG